jgi:hypothetical protein
MKQVNTIGALTKWRLKSNAEQGKAKAKAEKRIQTTAKVDKKS